jgi:hypothetical protein
VSSITLTMASPPRGAEISRHCRSSSRSSAESFS